MKGRGFALVLVMWVLVLLSILAASFSSMVRVETRSGTWATESTALEAATLAAINRAVLGASALDNKQRWRADGKKHRFVVDNLRVDIILRNESGKIDLNFAPRQLLMSLISKRGAGADARSLADALIDWRDRNNEPSQFGAENQDYLAAGLKYLPSNGPLTSVDELSQVLGFKDEIVEALRPFVTVYSRNPKVDVSAAPLQVLMALPGIDYKIAQDFIAQRKIALEASEPVDTTLLDSARAYISNHPVSSVINIELQAHLDRHVHREQAVVRLQFAEGLYEILSRTKLAEAGNTDPE